MADYSKITNEEFDALLGQIIAETPSPELILIPGIYEILSEHFNNEILERWAEDNPALAYPEDDDAADDQEDEEDATP